MSRLICALLTFLAFVSPSYGYNDYVILTYAQDGQSVDVDFGELMNVPDMSIDGITIDICTRNPDTRGRCGEDEGNQIDIPRTNRGHVIEDPGLYKLTLIDEFCGRIGCVERTVWEQFIVLFDSVENELQDAVVDYAPVYAFHEQIFEYFPVSIELLYERQFNDFMFSPKNRILYQDEINGEVVTHEFMKTNGHAKNRLYMNYAAAFAEIGDIDDFPTYWHAEKIDDNSYWISYISFFAYDRKFPEYLVSSSVIAANNGSHEVDRESVSVRFDKNENGWLPTEIVYAGHLEWQETMFRGCTSTVGECEAGVLLAEWDSGKTRVKYPNYARIGRKPVVYVAHGSHAQFPAYGYYGIDVSASVSFFDRTLSLNVLEPAGNNDQVFASGDVIQLDMRESTHQALTFSGFLIPSPIPGHPGSRVHPFIRFPITSWASDAGLDFNNCVEDNLGCQFFINREDREIQRVTNFSTSTGYFSSAQSFNENVYFTGSADLTNEQAFSLARGDAVEPIQLFDTNLAGDDLSSSLVKWRDRLYFVSSDDIGRPQVYRTDGESVSHLFLENGGVPDGVGQLFSVDDYLFTTVTTGSLQNAPAMVIRTEDGIEYIQQISTEISQARDFKIVDDKLFFIGRDADFNEQVFVSPDMSSARAIVGSPVSSTLDNVNSITEFQGELFFVFLRGNRNGGRQYELWRTDGVANATLAHALPDSSQRLVSTNDRIFIRHSANRNILSTNGNLSSVVTYQYEGADITGVIDMIPIDDDLYFGSFIDARDFKLARLWKIRKGEDTAVIMDSHNGVNVRMAAFQDELYYSFPSRDLMKIARDESVEIIDIGSSSTDILLYPTNTALYVWARGTDFGSQLWEYR